MQGEEVVVVVVDVMERVSMCEQDIAQWSEGVFWRRALELSIRLGFTTSLCPPCWKYAPT